MLCKVCGINTLTEVQVRGKNYTCNPCRYLTTKENKKQSNKKSRDKQKQEILNHYGESCAYCHATNDLQIDHIDGNGASHRKENRLSAGDQTARWIVKNNYPSGFQMLCKRCNAAKGDMSDYEFKLWVIKMAEDFKERI